MATIPATNNLPPFQSVELDYLWWGVCIGGRHYTGHIKFYDKNGFNKIEIERKLSLKEAKQYAQEQNILWHKQLSRISNKFETRESLEYHALQWCEKNLGENWILLDGDIINPSRAIGGKGWITSRIELMNKLASSWDKVSNSKREGELWDETYRLWEQIISPTWKPA